MKKEGLKTLRYISYVFLLFVLLSGLSCSSEDESDNAFSISYIIADGHTIDMNNLDKGINVSARPAISIITSSPISAASLRIDAFVLVNAADPSKQIRMSPTLDANSRTIELKLLREIDTLATGNLYTLKLDPQIKSSSNQSLPPHQQNIYLLLLQSSENTMPTTPGSNLPSRNPNIIADKLISLNDVRKKLGFASNQNFIKKWEDRKIPNAQQAPIEELMTKADFEILFPHRKDKDGHDFTGTYYTWENLVAASRYFPQFLNEGSLEDRYRELAALFANKSQEVGRAIGPAEISGLTAEKRYEYGLYYIVELAAFPPYYGAIPLKDQNELYEGYNKDYTAAWSTGYPPVEGKSYHGRGPVQLSWNYNYGSFSENLFGDKSILLENPNLVAREGLIGWVTAIWFWMEPQKPKPSCHDAMTGNVGFEKPYAPPTSLQNRSLRKYDPSITGSDAFGNPLNYSAQFGSNNSAGLEVGIGMTFNIINGQYEADYGENMRPQVARRIVYFAKYLDYLGTNKTANKTPISPQVGGKGGDPVPAETINLFKGWRNWYYLPGEGGPPNLQFPKDRLPSIITAAYQAKLQ